MFSCSGGVKESNDGFTTAQELLDSGEVNKAVTWTPNDAKVVGGPYSNPVLIYGTDFGRFFQTMYELGDYDGMLAFTSSESIERHGEDKIRRKYETMNFGFTLKLHSKKDNPDGTIMLNYNSEKFATKNVTRVTVKIENDSTKLVLPDNLKNLFKASPN